MATFTSIFNLRKPATTELVNVATDLNENFDKLDAHGHIGTYVALVPAPTGVAATDTAAIHAARDAAGNGGMLIFSAGIYLTAGLTASVVNQTWLLPPLTTIKLADASNINLLNVNSAGGFTLTGGGKLDGNRANQATAGAGLIFRAGTRNTCRGMQIVDSYGHGVMAIGNTNLRVQDNTILGAGGAGVWSEGDQDTVWITNNRIDDYAKVALFQSAGVHIKGGATAHATGIRVLANHITNGGSTGICSNPATFGVRDAWICDNTIIVTGSRGLASMGEGMALTGERLMIERNRVDQAFSQGILIWGAAKHCSIKGNKISNSSQDAAGGHAAIQLEATASYAAGDATIERCEITDNITWDDQGTKTQLRGTRIIAGGTFLNNVLARNVNVGNINTGIDYGGHTTGFTSYGNFGAGGQDKFFPSPDESTFFDSFGNFTLLGLDVAKGLASADAQGMRPTGVIASSVPRNAAFTTASSLVSGRETLVLVHLRAGQSVTGFAMVTGGTAVNAPTNQWFTLRNVSRQLLAVTNDDLTTAWGGDTRKIISLATPYTVPATGYYYVGIVIVGAGMGVMACVTQRSIVTATPPINVGYDNTNTGLTTPASAPATSAALTIAGNLALPYIEVLGT